MDSIEKTEPHTKKQKKQVVKGAVLHKLAEKLIDEIYNKKKKFKYFDVLKSQDFNFRTASGLLILKYKKYPFVLKLFIETPESFVKPFSKGWQPGTFFIMGGGINRYLSGFIRIKNLEAIKKQIKQDSEWREKLDTPRKWFWLSKRSRWFELSGKNIGKNTELKVTLPSIYGIFADAIDTDKQFNLLNRSHRESALKLSHFLGNRIDPHINNFIKEKDSDKILLVDTEHFPTMVGLRKPLHFTTYSSWYAQLTAKFLQDSFARTKRYRQKLQSNPEKIISVTETKKQAPAPAGRVSD